MGYLHVLHILRRHKNSKESRSQRRNLLSKQGKASPRFPSLLRGGVRGEVSPFTPILLRHKNSTEPRSQRRNLLSTQGKASPRFPSPLGGEAGRGLFPSLLRGGVRGGVSPFTPCTP